ncbi:MAG: acyltransferase [Promethearchaeota archaeon]
MPEFKRLGKNVKIYETAKLIRPEVIEIDDGAQIDDFTFIYGGKGAYIGRYVHIASFVSIIGGGMFYIGDYGAIAAGTRIITGTNTYEGGYHMSAAAPRETQNLRISYVRIERDGFIGTNVVLHPGITIGEGAIIGSNSLVLKDVKPWTINVGSPCRVIGKRPKVQFDD